MAAEIKESFKLHGPDQLKLNESGKFAYFYQAPYTLGDTVLSLVEVIRPDGSKVYPEIKEINFTFPTGQEVYGGQINYQPMLQGTHFIGVEIVNDTTGDIYYAVKAFHVPLWLNNIDKPISDIGKANTEQSRLRTVIRRGRQYDGF
jgi:hypothetical protein